jgi:hypothetical protein
MHCAARPGCSAPAEGRQGGVEVAGGGLQPIDRLALDRHQLRDDGIGVDTAADANG